MIPILIFFAVMALGGAVIVIRGWRRRMLESRLYRSDSASELFSDDAAVRSGRLVNTVEQIGRAVSPGKPESGLREWLARAGYYDDAAPTIYVGAQLVLSLLALTLSGAVAFSLDLPMLLRICICVAAVALFALTPNVIITLRRRSRTGDVRRNLPDAIDLLEICVSSGMALDMGWNAVCDEFRGVSQILADEMALSNLEMHLGAPRADAMRNMARRTGVQDIASLVATLVQSERFGTSVSQALRTYADALRTERSQRAEEAAEKLAIKLLFPMVMFIFPCMFIVILGPAGIRIREMFLTG